MGAARRMAAALWPLVVAVVVLAPVWDSAINLFNRRLHPEGRALAYSIAFGVVLYLAAITGVAARKKRRFFLAPISIPSRSSAGIPFVSFFKSVNAPNVYTVENQLFEFLGKSKRPELALDRYAWTVFCFDIAAYYGYVAFLTSSFDRPTTAILSGIAFVAALAGLYFLILGLRRREK